VIIGVTNIIPFFGPFIGAVPGTIIIALADPIKGVYFIIFILIIHQLDGNIIGPKILSNSTGLTPFWVVFAIMVGGGLFGFAGMLLGVPVFAVIYYIIGNVIKFILGKRKLPKDTGSYIYAVEIDKDSNDIIYNKKVRESMETNKTKTEETKN
jgi:predicted PurR-regulated permease PerM